MDFLIHPLMLLLAGLVQGADGQDKCPPDLDAARAQCQSLLVPNPNHPIYAPIIGGADADFAKDMCSSQSWLQGIDCMKRLDAACARDPKLSGMIRNCYSAENVRKGAELFCSNVNVYNNYAECYFNHQTGLRDCYKQFRFEVARLYWRGDSSTLESLIKGYCKAVNDRINCQDAEIRGMCGPQAADVVLSATRRMRAPRCSGAPATCMQALVLLLVTVLTQVLS